ncbi:NADH-ubiquinone oxidoreductase [Parvularcula bermudensis HTCC2503]|uniref:NADH-ubiquinone oxidoreductase n=1 Tax=Parvularcula bermudensis (strain ATCC BAA-594 / HTCC2503 / KCTC 12087) TaxID=314260 RepID=E0THW0_PARBH|nr:NADH:ubiquinone oxidoreductase subunit NDUFA12 [Parvularcula bermudensis]ADM10253.1 NADH-ubiquinone oxidoreductase [Parvularcula bermudensis HTCC2503]
MGPIAVFRQRAKPRAETLDTRGEPDDKSVMLSFIKRLFIWWHGATFGTSLQIAKSGGKLIGKDDQGNRYFEETGAPSHPDGGGRRRRWVVYHGVAEASRVPPDWFGWLNHIVAEPPTIAPLPVKKFEQPYLPNMTGTPLAYRPKGSLARAGDPVDVDDTYEAWSPENA